MKKLTIGFTLTSGALFAVLTSGCDIFMQKPLCKPLGECGGDPRGNWILAPGGSSCSEDLYQPPSDTRLTMGDIPPARTPPAEPALFDWCLLLVTNGGMDIQAKPPRFSVESPHVGAASVKIEDKDNTKTYSVGTTRTGTYILDFPAYCMRAFGAREKPEDPMNPTSPKVDLCKRIEGPVLESGLGEGAYRNITCRINPNDPPFDPNSNDNNYGCLCAFDVSAAGGGGGQWEMLKGTNNIIKHFPNTNFPQKTTFCQQGDRLQVTGTDGEYLFGQPGLRTMDLVRAP